MTIKFIDNASITYTNEEVDIDFTDAVSVTIDSKVTIEGSYDRVSNTITTTRSANIFEPISINIILDGICVQNGSSIIDVLHLMYIKQIKTKKTFKGVLKIVDLTTGQVRTHQEAFLSSDPEYKDRTIERGGTGSTYNIEFLCAQEFIN